ncbi:DUF4197 domain-containing protein [Catenovulum sediminis]|uniref:DUF4197 domain-containing protein n=1 Tax=Catenovulum sediminis TaxID=1740262 RepID=UPI00117DB0A8|nr:DUF4197 domain-containing protein [Catenovulum sediminis]
MTKNRIATAILLTTSIMVSPLANAESWFEKGLEMLTGGADKQNSADDNNDKGEFSSDDLSTAFKQALKIGTENVVNQLGQEGGFNADPLVHIPLPEEFNKIKKYLDKAGLSKYTDELEVKLNRAAEAATPQAKALFIDAIKEMSFSDVKAIYTGPNDSATQYFQNKMSAPLKAKMQPIVNASLEDVGAIQLYDKVVDRYKKIPFVPDIKADLTEHVIDKGIQGIFFYMAQEETKIRENPEQQTTELLKKVFGLN